MEYGQTNMEDLLRPIESAKKVQNNIQKFESLSLKKITSNKQSNNSQRTINPADVNEPILVISSTSKKKEPFLKPSQPQLLATATTRPNELDATQIHHKHHDSTVFTEQSYLRGSHAAGLPDNAREILSSQPPIEDLVAVLKYLQFGIDGCHDFNIHIANAKAAQILNVLVTVVVPDVWRNLRQQELSDNEATAKKIIATCLTSVAGIGALLTQIKNLSSSSTTTCSDVLLDVVDTLSYVLRGHSKVSNLLLQSQQFYPKELQRKLYWQEMTTILAGSRILSTLGQAQPSMPKQSDQQTTQWLSNGNEYSKWLAKNISSAAVKLKPNESESWEFLRQLMKRGMSLGYRDAFVAEIYTSLLLSQRALWTPLHLLLNPLAPYEQKNFFDSIVRDLAHKHLSTSSESNIAFSNDSKMQRVIAGSAALISGILSNNEILREHAEAWIIGAHNNSSMVGLTARRALIAALGRSEESLRRMLEKSLINFGDKLQIQQTSILQQETITQSILLIVGCLYRIDIQILKSPSISTLVMQSVSNRLAASIPRPRLLGMIVGTSISRLVDKPDTVVDFGIEEMQSEDVALWLSLVSLNDRPGSVTDVLHSSSIDRQSTRISKPRKPLVKSVSNSRQFLTSKVIAIEEIIDSSGSISESDDDLRPYQKLDSDAEDSEEDATLINRNKPSAPVYILDLIKQLQMSDKPDIVELALRTAPNLIRRKTGFGTELSDNIRTLVTELINLQAGMSEEELQQFRLDALIACIVANLESVGPSLADTYFRGDFSISQRIALLTAVGLSTRELAGFKDDQPAQLLDRFPSKRLPPHLEPRPPKQISATSNPVAMLTDTAARSTIRPMALAAADKMTGPSVLKIRTFSSRMEVEKKNQAKTAARSKYVPKNLHKILINFLFLPFCSRMSLLLSHTLGGRLPNTTLLQSSTIRLFIQTLTLVLHTLGPSASLHLSTITHETLLLLLTLHSHPYISTDPAILPALLHLLLALLDTTIEAGTTAQERLISDHGAQMSELVTWCNGLTDRVNVPDGESEENRMPWPVLAAGIQVKWFEIGRRFQGRMLGLSVDEMDRLAGS